MAFIAGGGDGMPDHPSVVQYLANQFLSSIMSAPSFIWQVIVRAYGAYPT